MHASFGDARRSSAFSQPPTFKPDAPCNHFALDNSEAIRYLCGGKVYDGLGEDWRDG
jgi:hypothetical protein